MEQLIQQFINISYHFNLRNPKADKPTTIFLVVRYNKRQYKFNIGVKVNPQHWNKKRERPIVSSYLSTIDNRNNSIANKRILLSEIAVKEIIEYICENPDTDVISLFNSKFNGGNTKMGSKKADNSNVVLDLRKLVDSSNTISEGSKKAYLTVLNNFSDFIKENGKDYISWSELESNPNILLDYSNWLYNFKSTRNHKITKEKNLNISATTINNRITVMCRLITLAKDNNISNISDDFLNKIRRTKSDNDKAYENQIALSEEEIELIKNVTLPDKYEMARDLFLFQTEVGQRYEDINGLKPVIEIKMYRGKKGCFFKIFQSKTSKYVYPPTTELSESILNKYNGHLPKIPITKIDSLLKDIARIAGINRLADCTEKRGGKNYNYQVEAWKLIGTHTARRSFITNWKNKGYPMEDIMKITGHTSQETANRYNRTSNVDAAFKFIEEKQPEQSLTTPTHSIDSNFLQEYKNVIEEKVRLQFEKDIQAKQLSDLQQQMKSAKEYLDTFNEEQLLTEQHQRCIEEEEDDIFLRKINPFEK